LADALERIAHYQFPFELNPITRAELEQEARVETGQKAADLRAILKTPPDKNAIARLSQDPVLNSTMRTTCVATRLAAGHANNALPQSATANINCRILPGHPREEVRQQLEKLIADPKVAIAYVQPTGGITATAPSDTAPAPAAMPPAVLKPLEEVVGQMWPGLPIVPTMSTGATDGVYTRPAGMPTYAILGVAIANDDIRAHGKDERIPVKSFDDGVDFYYRFLKALTSEK
jgi:acetylornithine deacetylase/succinyl-diaminopimelate desuccinylase-like protein